MITQSFIITVDTTISFSGTNNDQFRIGVNSDFSGQYSYDVDWGDGTTDTGVTGDIIHTYSSSGTYDVSITGGDFPAMRYSNFSNDAKKIIDVKQWGDNQWQSMVEMFYTSNGLSTLSATDTPDLSQVKSMKSMFEDNSNFNENIGNWDVSNVTNMSYMFDGTFSFNQNIGNWDVSSVTDMSYMFRFSFVFNQNISNWNVSNVTEMKQMFRAAEAFNQDISNWNVSNVTEMKQMFRDAEAFNQDLSPWCVENIPSKPTDFDNDAKSWTLSRPLWGLCPPEVETVNTTILTPFSVAVGYEITGVLANRGFVYAKNSTPVVADNQFTTSNTEGVYSADITGLDDNSTYYFRGWAKEDTIDIYDENVISVTIPIHKIELTFDQFTRGAQKIIIDYTVGTDYSRITERGIVWGTSPSPTLADNKVEFTEAQGVSGQQTISGLADNTTYYIRKYAIRDDGKEYFDTEKTITTLELVISQPTISDIAISQATWESEIPTNLLLGNDVLDKGFIYSTTNQEPNATDDMVVSLGGGDGAFSFNPNTLTPDTTYYVKAYFEINQTFTSSTTTFTTLPLDIQKEFQYLFFNAQGQILTVLQEADIRVNNTPTFTWSINGGKGSIEIQLLSGAENVGLLNQQETIPATVQVIVHDQETVPEGEIIYTGQIIDSGYTLQSNGFIKNDINLYASGTVDLENKIVEDSVTGATRISYTDTDFAEIIRDLLDKYQLKGGYVTYTSTTLPDTGITISITFANETFLEAIERLVGFLPRLWHFFVDGANQFWLRKTDLNTDAVNHVLLIEKDLDSGSLSLSTGEVVNSIFAHGGDDGTGSNVYKKYQRSASINSLGLREEIITDGRVTNTSTLDKKANRVLDDKAKEIRYIELTILDSNGSSGGYDIESIKPGDSIQVLYPEVATQFTLWYDSAKVNGNMIWDESDWNYSRAGILGVPIQVQEIQYNLNSITIKASDKIADLATTVQQLEFRQKLQETKDSPDTPS